MHTDLRIAFAAVFITASVSGRLLGQTPVVTSIQNPASNIPAILPNGGIAQGSIFVVYGVSLGPTPIQLAPSLPLPSTAGLGGTVVTVTVSGTTVNAPLVYSLGGNPSQVAGVLPSNTPLGTGSLAVSYNGKKTAPFPITVVQSNFGISTVDQTGGNAAVVTDENYKVVTDADSAKPGGTYVVWGTGLGAANSDNNIATNGDLGTPIQVWVGNVQATVTYRGRSAGPGLDQINFVVPSGLTGCEVSLAVQTGTTLSNYTTIAIASSGGQCSDVYGIPASALTPLLSKSSVNAAALINTQTVSTIITGLYPSTNTSVTSQATFVSFTQNQFVRAMEYQIFGQVSPGSCLVTISLQSTVNTSAVTYTGLNAGAAVTFTPPSGSAVTLSPTTTGQYQANAVSLLPVGAYAVSNGGGGTKVGPFTVNFSVPPFVTWTNQTDIPQPIYRDQGITVTWSGGDPSTFVDIQGGNTFGTTAANGGGIGFECTIPVGRGQFTVPPSVLLALPPGQYGYLWVEAVSRQLVNIPGMDFAYVRFANASGLEVEWW